MSNPWIVLKYGGTSVSSAANWDRIAARVRAALPTHRVWIVASALSQVSNRLESVVDRAVEGTPEDDLAWLAERHRGFAREMGIDGDGLAQVDGLLAELTRWVEGVRLTGEAPPRLRARVLAVGELASTRLGVEALAQRGIAARWVDARELLVAEDRPGGPEASRFLDARVVARTEPAAGERAADGTEVVLTQGFLASTARGETCVLGRGGSDTSAALFGALLNAACVEIWTDVHGMFTSDPRWIPSARLVRRIGYREAQELASMGAKVLHPRCLEPVAKAGIPLAIRNTFDPDAEGTIVGADDEDDPAVTAVVCRRGVTLVTLRTLSMWGAPGFLARAFEPFERRGVSVDLVATSQAAISVTLDAVPGGERGPALDALLSDLRALGEVEVVRPCAVVSVVGRRIRAVLHELGPALAVFREHPAHLVSASSEDLNLSFVVDEEAAAPLVRELHGRLFPPQAVAGDRFGDTWERLAAREAKPVPVGIAASWWRAKREALLALAADGRARYVYDLATVAERAQRLRREIPAVSRWFYAMKANPHPAILETVAGAGFGFECVSLPEVRRVREIAGTGVAILFTPNFCPPEEYAAAMALGAEVTIDGPEILAQAPMAFRGGRIGVRIDPGEGLGHHDKVRTAGAHAKFGQPIAEFDRVLEAAAQLGCVVVGLHAHLGSGIFRPGAWGRTAADLAGLRGRLPELAWVDVGGGLGVVERPGQDPLDLSAVQAALAGAAGALPGIELRMEPGRFLVSEAGTLLAPVTQVRSKGAVRFAGVATGMNSLIRPALYGAWHAIHNLSSPDGAAARYWHVVGPICESGDVLGRDRLLPDPRPGDVLLIENCGAYGAAMASSYNLRDPAEEHVLRDS